MKYDVAAESARLGIGQLAIDRTEYEEFVRHHIECERLATAVAELAKRVLPPQPHPRPEHYDQLAEAIRAFDAHQWPEDRGESNAR